MVLGAFLPQVPVVFPYFPACIFRSHVFLWDWEMLSSISSTGKAWHDTWAKNHRIVFWGSISNCSLVPARLVLHKRGKSQTRCFSGFGASSACPDPSAGINPGQLGALLIWPSPFEPPVGLLPAGEVPQCSNASPVSPEVLMLCSRWALSRCQVDQLETSLCQVNPKVERWSCFLVPPAVKGAKTRPEWSPEPGLLFN